MTLSRTAIAVSLSFLSLSSLACIAACDDSAPPAATAAVPSTYTFESSFSAGDSSISYTGQTARQVLISELASRIGALTDAVDGASWALGTTDDVYRYLDYYMNFDSDTDGAEAITLATTPPVAAAHATYGGISGGKNILGKLAGEDDTTDHKDWDGGGFIGWAPTSLEISGNGTVDSPKKLVEALLWTLAGRATDRANGSVDQGPYGKDLPVHVTPAGQDLQQLTQKFLLMAVNYSQGTDDYLDSDIANKGLLSALDQDGDKPFAKLEHAWDEAYGYFGAARDYDAYSDDEIARKDGRDDWQGYHDSDGDGGIQLDREYNWAASANAAKRDRGAKGSSQPTDFTGDASKGFRTGRAIIAQAVNAGSITAAQTADLEAARDQVVTAWEGAIAATCVHYLNEVLADMAGFGGDTVFVDYAKHWSELKGFSLGLQFNPRSRLTAAQFAEVHALLGDAPVSPAADTAAIEGYKGQLRAARDIFMAAYQFPADLKGDDAGSAGW